MRKQALPSSCQLCNLRHICLPIALAPNDLSALDHVLKQGRTVDRGEHVFRNHQKFSSCYAVRSGALKTYAINNQGEEQVLGFYLPGEILGLDSVAPADYSCSAIALEKSSVCEIPFNDFESLANDFPSLQQYFIRLMSTEIRESRKLSMLLGNNTAEERLAAFLLNLSERFEKRKLSATSFRLPMPRNDIANYLGLAVETVSRILSRFQKQRCVQIQGREVEILDMTTLIQVARCECPEAKVLPTRTISSC